MRPGRPEPTSRLARRLGTADAVVIGLGAMVGAGVFAAFQPAAEAAGSGLLVGLGLAGLVAWCNATSSAQLAALYPLAGGTYVYGRERLGHVWGYLAGWAFVVGKTASCAAMALTFGVAVAPGAARPLAIAAVVAVTAVDLRGVRRTALATRVILTVVLGTLAVVVVAGVAAPSAGPAALGPGAAVGGPLGVLRAAGFLFFAFAGYARIATLGEEVLDPSRTIPRAIPRALFLTLGIYLAVAVAGLLAIGPEGLAASRVPLVAVVQAGPFAALAPAVRLGAAVAALGVLLSLVAGIGRTAFAMAGEGDLPGALAAVHPRTQVPARAQVSVALVVSAVLLVADLRGAIGFSSFGVLVYYGIANASALTLPAAERRWPRWIAALGVAGCGVLAASLPASSVGLGLAVLAVGLGVFAIGLVVRRRRP